MRHVGPLSLLSFSALLTLMIGSSATPLPGATENSAQDQSPSSEGGIPMPPESELVHPEIPRIAPQKLKQLLDEKADIVIVDTQDPEGYDMWHVPTAVNIPYNPMENPREREMRLVALPMSKLIVIYCLCESGADSANMAAELRKLGYAYGKVRVLADGLIKWEEAGYPLVKKETP